MSSKPIFSRSDSASQDAAPTSFEGWAIVELMGHQREVGYVTTQYFGVACLFRIDSPELPEREYVLRRPEYARNDDGTQWAPVGSKVRRRAVPAKSRLVGPPAIYAINPCTEEAARVACEELIRPALILLELPKDRQPVLTIGGEPEAESFDDDEEAEGMG